MCSGHACSCRSFPLRGAAAIGATVHSASLPAGDRRRLAWRARSGTGPALTGLGQGSRLSGTHGVVRHFWSSISAKLLAPAERFKRSRSLYDRCRVTMLRELNDDHASIRPRRGAFSTSVGQHREFHCFFPARMARRSSASHLSSGRGGDCFRDPFLPNNSSAFAYQPKHPLAKSVRHPLVNQ